MQEEQHEHTKFKLYHWIWLHVFKESGRFAIQIGYEPKLTKSSWDRDTYFYWVDNASSEEKQNTAIDSYV